MNLIYVSKDIYLPLCVLSFDTRKCCIGKSHVTKVRYLKIRASWLLARTFHVVESRKQLLFVGVVSCSCTLQCEPINRWEVGRGGGGEVVKLGLRKLLCQIVSFFNGS